MVGAAEDMAEPVDAISTSTFCDGVKTSSQQDFLGKSHNYFKFRRALVQVSGRCGRTGVDEKKQKVERPHLTRAQCMSALTRAQHLGLLTDRGEVSMTVSRITPHSTVALTLSLSSAGAYCASRHRPARRRACTAAAAAAGDGRGRLPAGLLRVRRHR
jgi:hypothetical protein